MMVYLKGKCQLIKEFLPNNQEEKKIKISSFNLKISNKCSKLNKSQLVI